MAGQEQFSDLDPTVQLANKYTAIPQEDRQAVLAGLMLATRHAPTADELYRARQLGGGAEMAIEDRYGALADAYAHLIDNRFDYTRIRDNNPQTEEKRMNFYMMIRTLSAEQVVKGVTGILRNEGKDTPRQQ